MAPSLEFFTNIFNVGPIPVDEALGIAKDIYEAKRRIRKMSCSEPKDSRIRNPHDV